MGVSALEDRLIVLLGDVAVAFRAHCLKDSRAHIDTLCRIRDRHYRKSVRKSGRIVLLSLVVFRIGQKSVLVLHVVQLMLDRPEPCRVEQRPAACENMGRIEILVAHGHGKRSLIFNHQLVDLVNDV